MSAYVKNSACLRVLYIPLEFKTWQNASHFPYSGNYGFEEGFAANRVEFLTIPAIYETISCEQTSWLSHARELCAGKNFDQVWLEIVHSRFDEDFLDWTTTIAPVRIGFIWESWETHPDELVSNPEGTKRRRINLERNLKFLTHVVAIDEKDVERFNAHGPVKAKWLWDAGIVPESFICKELPPTPAPNNCAVFYGALYGERKKWLEHSALKGLLVRPTASLEYTTNLPALFDKLNATSEAFLKEGHTVTEDFFSTYIDSLRVIRRECFVLWLKGLSMGAAIVNLPQFGKGYASRVLEGMAAGRPVISCEIPDRPRTKALFEDGKEILLYKGDNPYQLAEHIQRILREPDFAKRISANARSKIKNFHTTERLVRQILDWVENSTTGLLVKEGKSMSNNKVNITGSHDCLSELRKANLWNDNHPLRLHLGCGEQYLEGYVNIDYPPSEHNVMDVKADVYANINNIEFPPGSVDEIRLHHVFEHFNRVTALAMLIKWHGWLKIGGKLHIVTPDIIGSARTLLSNSSLKTKMGVVRHLAGDQTSSWGFHIDHWFPDRFEHTLQALGFDKIETRSESWKQEPYLSNVEVVAIKYKSVDLQNQLMAADRLLWESTVTDEEKPTYKVWVKQLREVLNSSEFIKPTNVQLPDITTISDNQIAPATSSSITHTAKSLQSHEFSVITQALEILASVGSKRPLPEILDFNQKERDKWVRAKAESIPAGSRVLDVGAGTCPYRSFFTHCVYNTHDFKKYEGVKLGNMTEYGSIDYTSEITNIPVPDNSFDVILCTEVLEHVPEPIEAMREMARILRIGGRMLLTTPLGARLHQLPYHYYGGFTPEWYKLFCPRFDLQLIEITPNGGFLKLLAQECAHAAGSLPELSNKDRNNIKSLRILLGDWIPRYLYAMDEKFHIEQSTVGYHVEIIKKDHV